MPDGEPHVFGDRVYLYGSHDALTPTGGDHALYLCYQGRGRLDILDFTLN